MMIAFTDEFELVQALAIVLRHLEKDPTRTYETSLVAVTLQQVTTSLTREYVDGRDVLAPPIGINDQIMISGELEQILTQHAGH